MAGLQFWKRNVFRLQLPRNIQEVTSPAATETKAKLRVQATVSYVSQFGPAVRSKTGRRTTKFQFPAAALSLLSLSRSYLTFFYAHHKLWNIAHTTGIPTVLNSSSSSS